MSNTLNVEIDVNLTMQHCDDNIYLTNGDKLTIHHYTDSYEEHRWYVLRDIIVNYKDKLWRMPWFETLKANPCHMNTCLALSTTRHLSKLSQCKCLLRHMKMSKN